MNATEAEILNVCRSVASGHAESDVVSPRTWSGNITVQAEGWTLVVFMDCNEVDYIDSASSSPSTPPRITRSTF